jgi:hypothetical protein
VITVADLKDRTGVAGPHPIMYCFDCDMSYSANAGDYWFTQPSTVLKCGQCKMPMKLCLKTVTYEEVQL